MLTLRVDDLSPETATEVEDRAGALDGRVQVERRRRRPRAPAHRAAVRIVLAEDEVLLREGLARLLTDAGFEVVGKAGDAAALLRLVDARRPELVLTDIRMPPTHSDEGLAGRTRDRPPAPRHGRAGALALPRVRLRAAPAGGPPRAVRLPAQGPRLRRRRPDRRAAPDRAGRVRDRPDDRLAPARPPPQRPARGPHRPRARDPRADGRGTLQRRHLPRCSSSAPRRSRATSTRSSSSSTSETCRPTTGACSPCCGSCVRASAPLSTAWWPSPPGRPRHSLTSLKRRSSPSSDQRAVCLSWPSPVVELGAILEHRDVRLEADLLRGAPAAHVDDDVTRSDDRPEDGRELGEEVGLLARSPVRPAAPRPG